ncbi:hypothetical protein ABIE67_009104 [Streptomyces sp. V4I8]|uniref:hypothetical protein n=1 Tax=Streptomyces sp. V4I8 TaxID=3156469 RepID=UPI0035115B94
MTFLDAEGALGSLCLRHGPARLVDGAHADAGRVGGQAAVSTRKSTVPSRPVTTVMSSAYVGGALHSRTGRAMPA